MLEQHDDFPSVETIWKWRRDFPEFSQGYALAHEMRLELMAEDIQDISDDDSLDPNDKRLRVDTRKWLLSKLKAKVYGDKLDVTSGGEAMTVPTHMIDARVQSIIMTARARKVGGQSQGETLDLDANALKLLE